MSQTPLYIPLKQSFALNKVCDDNIRWVDDVVFTRLPIDDVLHQNHMLPFIN